MSVVTHLIVPAAGLGTRLRPLTETQSKEMLPLGGRPTLFAALLEAKAASLERVTIVVHPRKRDLVEWLSEQTGRWPFALDTVVQPAPAGSLDAVRHGRGDAAEACAVLYPDMLAPNQQGLRSILATYQATGSCVLGAQRVTAENLEIVGRTGRFVFTDGSPYQCGGSVERMEAAVRSVGAWHSVFAEVRTPRFFAVEAELGSGDERAAEIYNRVAADGLLVAADLSANDTRPDVLDTGTMDGYRDAVARFDDGSWRWRERSSETEDSLAEAQRRRGSRGEGDSRPSRGDDE